jgi:hypothetical protein
MGGFTYQNNKNNSRIYKNSDEFSSCSVFLREFKIGLQPFLGYLPNGRSHQRLISLFLKIKTLDGDSSPGFRTVAKGLATLKGRQLYRDFVFTPKVGIRQSLAILK